MNEHLFPSKKSCKLYIFPHAGTNQCKCLSLDMGVLFLCSGYLREFAQLCSWQNSELLAPLSRGPGSLGAAFVSCLLCAHLFLQIECQSRYSGFKLCVFCPLTSHPKLQCIEHPSGSHTAHLLGKSGKPFMLVLACPCLPPSVPAYLFLSPSLFPLSEILSLPYFFFLMQKDNIHTEKHSHHESSAQGILKNSNQHPGSPIMQSPLLVPASLQGQPHPYLELHGHVCLFFASLHQWTHVAFFSSQHFAHLPCL